MDEPGHGQGRAAAGRAGAGRWWWIALVVLVGVSLRAVPIPWGTTYAEPGLVGLHPDEPKLIRFADRFPGSVAENEDYRYPLLMHDVLGVLWQGALRVAPMEPDAVPASGEPRFERATVFSRAVYVLLFGLGGFALLAALTRRLGPPGAVPWVLAAASMQAFTVANTALAQTDLPVAFALAALLLALLGIEQRGGWRPVRDPLVLGALLGVAVACKYTGLVGALMVAALVARAALRGEVRPRAVAGGALLFLGAAAAVFLAAVPGAVFDFEHFRESLAYELDSKTQQASFDAGRFLEHLTTALPPWLALLAAAGLAVTPRARRSPALLGALGTLAVYLFAVRQALQPDWVLPLMPTVAVLSGLALHALATRLRAPGAAVAIGLVLAGWTHSALTVRARYVDDTRYRFDAWVRETIAPPGPIGEAPAPTRRSWASARAPEGYRFVSALEAPEWIVMSEREFEPVMRVHADPRAFEFAGVVFDPDEKRLAALGPADIDLFRDLLREDPEFRWTPPEGHEPRFDYDLVERFEPAGWPLDMAGLEIRVYRRR